MSHGKDKKVYSARINLEYWPYKALCKILSQTPTISIKDPKKETLLSVRYKTFRAFNVHLKPKFFDNYLQYILTEKVAQVQDDIVNINKKFQFTSECLIDRLKDAIKNADITGFTSTNIFKTPSSSTSRYSQTPKNTWLQIDLKEEFAFNNIHFRLWDGDDRTYTYNLAVSLDNKIWKDIAINKPGKSVQNLELPELMHARYIKMNGYSTSNAYLHLIYFYLEFK